MKQDVTKFIKTCHICQLVGKPNECISPAPLKAIPFQTEPFEKIIIDCVGPLPRTKKGNQYSQEEAVDVCRWCDTPRGGTYQGPAAVISCGVRMVLWTAY